MKPFSPSLCARRPAPDSAFTMIEIAMALAIIGFAMVAIIGVLPMGMDVQKNNRRETIVNQDANYLIEAIRNGARGLDDLTNYVIAITNDWKDYNVNNQLTGNAGNWWWTPTNSWLNSDFTLTNGDRIIGLLSEPKYIRLNGAGDYRSNYVTGYFRALSGAAFEKAPQDNQTVKDAAFSYRVVSDIVPYGAVRNTYYDSNSVQWNASMSANEIAARSNYSRVVDTLNHNLYDVRLLFRWPLLPGGKIGNGRQAYRLMVSGSMTNIPGAPTWFFLPQGFAQ